MTYLSLYRLHRPHTFADITGQEHITRTLSNALVNERLAHAYLFCGPRGTGKTTVAKILARAVNCEHYPAPEPCGNCSACKNIAAGVSMDVIEMDAASNRGIDEIRDLRERTRYATGENRYKVYIIDEAHMLTTEACNAFLKTLEEPPQKVIFILATTDPSRLPSTIVSRCQRFDFHLLTVDQIRNRLELILKKEKRLSDTEAIILMARLAEGSLRDALGILEQCAAYSEESISAENVRIVTGATMTETIETLIKAALENNPDSGLEIIEQVVSSGRDLQLLVRDLTFIFSRFLLAETSKVKTGRETVHGFEDLIKKYRDRIDRDLVLEAVELWHEVGNELKHARTPQFIMEVSFIRLLRLLHGRQNKLAVESKNQVSEKDDKKLAGVSSGLPENNSEVPNIEKTAHSAPGFSSSQDSLKNSSGVLPAASGAEKLKEVSPESDLFARLKEDWPRIIRELKKKQKSTAAWLEPARLDDLRGRLICLSYPAEYTMHQLRIMENSHRKLVEEVLSDYCQMPVNIKADFEQQEPADEDNIKTQNAVQETSSTYDSNMPGHADNKDHESKAKLKEVPSDKSLPTGQNDPENRSQGKEQQQGSLSAEEAMELFGGQLINPD